MPADCEFCLLVVYITGTSTSYSQIYLAAICSVILIGFNYACLYKEYKLCYHMNHFNSPKCKQCQLAIGGKLTAKVSLRKVRSVKCVEI